MPTTAVASGSPVSDSAGKPRAALNPLPATWSRPASRDPPTASTRTRRDPVPPAPPPRPRRRSPTCERHTPASARSARRCSPAVDKSTPRQSSTHDSRRPVFDSTLFPRPARSRVRIYPNDGAGSAVASAPSAPAVPNGLDRDPAEGHSGHRKYNPHDPRGSARRIAEERVQRHPTANNMHTMTATIFPTVYLAVVIDTATSPFAIYDRERRVAGKRRVETSGNRNEPARTRHAGPADTIVDLL
jgi:hypothetical protein